MTNVPSTTQFVPNSDEYTAPERPFDRIRAITSKLQPVDGQGHDRPRRAPDPSVTPIVEPAAPGPAPSMADALTKAAAAVVGADLSALQDSNAFLAAIATVSPSNDAELQEVIRDFTPAPTTPGMAPNPAQGHGSATVPRAPANLLERLQMETEKALSQPEPPSAQPYGSRTKGDQ